MPRRRSAPTKRLDRLVEHAVDEAVVDQGHGGVRPHAAGVGALVVVADALEVLGRRQRQRCESRHRARAASTRGPPDPSSTTTRRPASPKLSPDSLAAMSASASSSESVTSTPLPAARPSVFTTQGPGSSRRNAWAALGVVEGAVAGGGHAGLGQDLLHEGLGPLEPGPVGAGAEHEAAIGAQLVGQAVHERLLGADHEQIGVDVLGGVGAVTVTGSADPGEVRRVGRLGRVRRHARVARGHHHLGGAGQDSARACSRPARPTTQTFMPRTGRTARAPGRRPPA